MAIAAAGEPYAGCVSYIRRKKKGSDERLSDPNISAWAVKDIDAPSWFHISRHNDDENIAYFISEPECDPFDHSYACCVCAVMRSIWNKISVQFVPADFERGVG